MYDWVLGKLGFALDRACRFPYLRNLSLNLTQLGELKRWNQYNIVVDHGHLEEMPFKVLLVLFKTLTCVQSYTERTAPIRGLELYGIPPLHQATLLKSAQFEQCMRAVQQLTLHFGKWHPEPAHKNTNPRRDFPSSMAPFVFAASLTGWLVFGQQTREKLDLSFDDYIGYYPKLDLKNIHYPWLKELRLQGITISHDRQITWITDHGDTLQNLHLVNCPLLIHVRTFMELGKHNYPNPSETAADPINLSNKKIHWVSVMDQFTAKLRRLRDFSVSFLRPRGNPVLHDHGMVGGRYKVYFCGRLLKSTWSDENYLLKDTKAYIKLLKHTGQWKTSDLAIVKEGDKAESTIAEEAGEISIFPTKGPV
jgi:hypothetical protein